MYLHQCSLRLAISFWRRSPMYLQFPYFGWHCRAHKLYSQIKEAKDTPGAHLMSPSGPECSGENFIPPHLTLLHKQRHPVQSFSLPRSSAALVHAINIDTTWNPHFKLGWPISWKDADSLILGPHVSEADKPNYWTEYFLKSALWT